MAGPFVISSSTQPISSHPGGVAPPRTAGAGKGGKGGGNKGNKGGGGGSLQQQAHDIANAQTVGPISELAKQIAQNNQQSAASQQQDFGYYMQLAQAAKDAVTQSGQVASGLNSTLAGIGQGTQTALQGIGQQAQQGAVGRMNALGLGGSSAQDLAAATAQQQGTGLLNAQTFQSQGANQGASNQGQQIGQLGATGLEGTAAISQLANRTQVANEPLNARMAALQASKGALYGTALGQLQSNQTKNAIALAAITGRTNASILSAQTSRQNNAANNRTSRANTQARNAQSALNNLRTTTTSANNNRANNQTRAAVAASNNATRQLIASMRNNASTGKAATPVQTNAVYSHIDYVTGELQELITQGVQPVAAYHLLQNGGRVQVGGKGIGNQTGAPKYRTYYPNRLGTQILNAAYNVRSGGNGLSPGDVAWLKSLGIKNPQSRYSATKVGGAVTGAGTPGGF